VEAGRAMMFRRLEIVRTEGGESVQATDAVAVEEPLEILVNGRNLSLTMRTPGHDEELAIGFLFTEGIVTKREHIRAVSGAGNRAEVEITDASLEPQNRRFTMTSACGVCGKESAESLFANACLPVATGTFRIDATILRKLPATLRSAQTVFEQTGGIHAAGLFDSAGKLELLREDVGRHNAVDKLIGALFLAGRIPAKDRLMLVSGRVSFELVQKAAMAGIPALAAVGAPSTLAIETAQRFGTTLIGFLRHDRFNIYNLAGRIG